MGPEVSLPLLQEPAISPYSQPAQSSLALQTDFLKIDINIIIPSTPRFSK